MSDKLGGEPAFPTSVAVSPAGDVHQGFFGITVRDYFAAQALAVFLQNTQINQWGDRMYAERSYAVADAMLAERSK